jgi:hypothetical protein
VADRKTPLHAVAWIDAPALLAALGPVLERLGVGDGRRALVTGAEVLFAADVDLAAIAVCAKRRADCRKAWGTPGCCGDARDAVVALGSEAAGTDGLDGEIDASVLVVLDAPQLAEQRAHVLDLARRRQWQVPDERDLMVEWFVPGRGGPPAYYDDARLAARAFASPEFFPPRDARVWLWDRNTPHDALCWRRSNFTPALNLAINNIASRNVRNNFGCKQNVLMHGCGIRTYAFLLDQHLALLAASDALAPRNATPQGTLGGGA